MSEYPALLPQARLFSSSFPALRESTVSCSQRTAVIPLFQMTSCPSLYSIPRTSKRGGKLLFPATSSGLAEFTATCPVTSLSSLSLFGVLARRLQLTVNDMESLFLVSFHANRLSSSFSSLFRTSTIDFGIILAVHNYYFSKTTAARFCTTFLWDRCFYRYFVDHSQSRAVFKENKEVEL